MIATLGGYLTSKAAPYVLGVLAVVGVLGAAFLYGRQSGRATATARVNGQRADATAAVLKTQQQMGKAVMNEPMTDADLQRLYASGAF